MTYAKKSDITYNIDVILEFLKMNAPSYAAIILAAGLSSRMSHFKPLLKVNGAALIDRAIGLFPPDSVDVYIVTGHRREELERHIVSPGITLIENPDYLKGMFSSVRAGVGGLKKEYKAFFVLPVDIPQVRPFTITRMLEKARDNPDKIIYPVFNGQRGHPPLIPSAIIPSILESSGEGGLKGVLQQFNRNTLAVSVPDRFILTDIDTDSDYDLLCGNFTSYEIPSDQECEAVFDIYDVEVPRRAHCLKVAEVAERIGLALIKNDHSVNLELIRAAALLHDIAKKQHQHDLAGASILRMIGFNRTADIVEVHTFLQEDRTERSLEAVVVYLSDKFVQGERIVSLDERYSLSSRPFEVTPEIKRNIAERKRRAKQVKKELEDLIGCPLEQVIVDRDHFSGL